MNTLKMRITTSLSNYFSDVRVMKQNKEVSTGESDMKMITTGDISMVEYLPSIHEIPGIVRDPSTERKTAK